MSFAIAVQSCSKVATNGSLDGSWAALDGTLSSSMSQTESSSNYTSNQNLTFDGTTMKGTQVTVYAGQTFTSNLSYPFELNMSFDKKAGTYTRDVVSTSTNTGQTESMYSANNEYEEDVNVTSVDQTTESESGTFQLAGGNGEVEKSSILLLQRSNYTETTVSNYTYTRANGSTYNITGKKVYRPGGLVAAPSTETYTSSSTGNGDYDETITIVEVKKDVITIAMDRTDSYIDGSVTGTYTSKAEFNLGAK